MDTDKSSGRPSGAFVAQLLLAVAGARRGRALGQGRRCNTTTPCSAASRSATIEPWHASGSRSTQNSATAPSAGSSSTSGARSTRSRISCCTAFDIQAPARRASACRRADGHPRRPGVDAARSSAPAPFGGDRRPPPWPAPPCSRTALAHAARGLRRFGAGARRAAGAHLAPSRASRKLGGSQP